MFQLVMVWQLNLITILKAFSRVKILFFMGCFDVDISPVKLAPCFIILQTTGWNLLWRNIIICFYEIHKVMIMKHPYNNSSPVHMGKKQNFNLPKVDWWISSKNSDRLNIFWDTFDYVRIYLSNLCGAVRGLSQITFALRVGRWSEKRVVYYIKSAN